MMKVKVKHGKTTVVVDLDISGDIHSFLTQIQDKTGVAPECQTLMIKGKKLVGSSITPSERWAPSLASKIKPNSLFLLISSAPSADSKGGASGAIGARPKDQVKFIEDLTPEEARKAMAEKAGSESDPSCNWKVSPPIGLENLGNTCYLNAFVQCLKTIGPLDEWIQIKGCAGFGGSQGQGSSSEGRRNLLLSLSQLLFSLDADRPLRQKRIASTILKKSGLTPTNSDIEGFINQRQIPLSHSDSSDSPFLQPFLFVQLFRSVFPHFAERASGGGDSAGIDPSKLEGDAALAALLSPFKQQDAEEAMGELLRFIEEEGAQAGNDLGTHPVSSVFGGENTDSLTTVKKEPTDEEEKDASPPKTEVVPFLSISCHIDSSTCFLLEGIQKAMKETIEIDDLTNRERESQITKLPRYLAIKFIRFFWRKDKNIRVKIMRPVEFPPVLDIQPFCSEPLKTKIQSARLRHMSFGDDDTLLVGDEGKSAPDDGKIPYGLNGMYELVSVLTHKGRADGGHYIGWVNNESMDDATNEFVNINDWDFMGTGEERRIPPEDVPKKKKQNQEVGKGTKKEKEAGDWWRVDDTKSLKSNPEEVKSLSGKGGADWHIAYLCFYRAIVS